MEIERVINEAREKYEAAEFIIKEQPVFLAKEVINKAIEITSVSKEKYIVQEVRRYIEVDYIRKENLPTVEEIKQVIKSNHIYCDFNNDVDSFVTIPLNKLAQAIAKRIGKEE